MNLDQRIDELELCKLCDIPVIRQAIKQLISEAIDYCTPERHLAIDRDSIRPEKSEVYALAWYNAARHIESKKQELLG